MILSLILALAACDTPTPPEADATPPAAAEAPVPAELDGLDLAEGGDWAEWEGTRAPHGAPAGGTWTWYGDDPKGDRLLTAHQVLRAPESYVGQRVTVEGEIRDVCQKAGCWMVIGADEQTARVLMKDHAFSVPKDAGGRWARVQGTLERKEVDPETTAHFASESSKPEAMPETKAKAGVVYELVASAVAVRTEDAASE